MWTPTVLSADKDNGQVQVQVEFTSDAKDLKSYVKEFFSITSFDDLKRAVKSEIARVTAVYAVSDVVTPLIGSTLDTVIPVQEVDPATKARIKYFKDLAVLHRMQESIKDGTMKESDQAYIDQQILVKAEFLPEYNELP
jgi:hypothetical protein